MQQEEVPICHHFCFSYPYDSASFSEYLLSTSPIITNDLILSLGLLRQDKIAMKVSRKAQRVCPTGNVKMQQSEESKTAQIFHCFTLERDAEESVRACYHLFIVNMSVCQYKQRAETKTPQSVEVKREHVLF